MNVKPHIVIIGANSSIATECARLWSDRPCRFTLVGRNLDKLERLAKDLESRNNKVDLRLMQTAFGSPLDIQKTVDIICTQHEVNIVLIAHGSLPDQASCQQSLNKIADALYINATSCVLFAEAFAHYMDEAGGGTLAIIGSVAGDRGRKSNYIYGAAKGLVTRYVQGLQHRFAKSPLKIILIKPGPTDTAMTAHLKAQGAKLSPVNDVARIIVKGIDQGKPVIYAPKKWVLIMMIIRHLPRFIFNRMDI